MNEIVRTPDPVRFFTVKPTELHEYWPFILGHPRIGVKLPATGLLAIQAKMRVDWRPEDIYMAIRGGNAICLMVSRETTLLGYVVYYEQRRPWSGKLDLFIWVAWGWPACLSTLLYNMPEAVLLTWQELGNIKRKMGAENIVWIGRKGFERTMRLKAAYYTYIA